MCKNPQNAAIRGLLPPISVDNHVDSVDFCEEHTLYIHRMLCSFNRKFVTFFAVIKNE